MPTEKIDWDDFTSLEEIVKLYYIDHKSVNEIASHLGVGETTLWRYMADNGLPCREQRTGYITLTGPPCPHCGSRKSRIIHSEPAKRWYKRRRRCLSCGRKFTTREVLIDELEWAPPPF